VRLEIGSLQVDENARQVLAHREADGGDDGLAGVDGDEAEALLAVFGRFGVALHDAGDDRQALDGLLDVRLKRGRQWHGEAVARPLQQLRPDAHREVAGAVDDRQHADARAEAEEVGGGRWFAHGVIVSAGDAVLSVQWSVVTRMQSARSASVRQVDAFDRAVVVQHGQPPAIGRERGVGAALVAQP